MAIYDALECKLSISKKTFYKKYSYQCQEKDGLNGCYFQMNKLNKKRDDNMNNKEDLLEKYRKHIIGYKNGKYSDLNGNENVYADWCGTAKMYDEIEYIVSEKYGSFYSNLHSVGNPIVEFLEEEYFEKKEIIKKHFGADDRYVLLENSQGMTLATNQFIEIIRDNLYKPEETVVIVSAYEHNSNYVTWLKYGYEVEIIKLDSVGEIDINHYETLLKKNKNKKIIVAISACSNVVGIMTNIRQVTQIAKKYNALVFVDYTACAPYVKIDIGSYAVDAMVCSMHKFVGGVQGIGILILKRDIYKKAIPTRVGGGTVRWVSPYGKVLYKDDICFREMAGTPPILQMIRSGLAIQLKESIGIDLICKREKEIAYDLGSFMKGLEGLNMFMPNVTNRLPYFSFVLKKEKYKETVKKLCTEYNIQARGGCCCASLFMHYIFCISQNESEQIYKYLRKEKKKEHEYGWVRISLNYLTSDVEIQSIKESLMLLSEKI